MFHLENKTSKHTTLIAGIDGRSMASVIQLRAMKNRIE
jgi:hypothetical protein